MLALGEMTGAERSVGHISRAEDSDPYLAGIRAAVAREGQTYSQDYREGSGEGVRYSAFDRYTQLARQSLQRLETARTGLTAFRAQAKPLDPTDTQLKSFHQVYDAIPWTDAEQALHGAHFEKLAVPAYADFVDRTVSGQEDLLVAFQELVSAPTPRHILALALAAFIDIIVFLLAWSSGPFFFGGPEQRWLLSAAAIDALDPQIFVPRTRFVLEHWNNVSTGVREEALEAVRAGWLNWIQQHEIQMLPRRIANPAGRLAIALEIAKLSSLSGLAGR